MCLSKDNDDTETLSFNDIKNSKELKIVKKWKF